MSKLLVVCFVILKCFFFITKFNSNRSLPLQIQLKLFLKYHSTVNAQNWQLVYITTRQEHKH